MRFRSQGLAQPAAQARCVSPGAASAIPASLASATVFTRVWELAGSQTLIAAGVSYCKLPPAHVLGRWLLQPMLLILVAWWRALQGTGLHAAWGQPPQRAYKVPRPGTLSSYLATKFTCSSPSEQSKQTAGSSGGAVSCTGTCQGFTGCGLLLEGSTFVGNRGTSGGALNVRGR